ncbi:MAG: hypothetical protein PSU94_16985 [Lacunisphaera sp.]|nr:hypothetical protein [Lacunisphaera sp.]
MSQPAETSGPERRSGSPFLEVRYSLADLLQEVQRDRASSAFAMEKLDQPAITALFELQQQRARRDPGPTQ